MLILCLILLLNTSIYSDSFYFFNKNLKTFKVKVTDTSNIDEDLSSAVELINTYYRKNKNKKRVRRIKRTIEEIKKDKIKKGYIKENIKDSQESKFYKLGFIIGGIFIIDEFLNFNKYKNNMPVLQSSNKNMFEPNDKRISFKKIDSNKKDENLIRGINAGIHEFTHALPLIKTGKKISLSELATSYTTILYVLPFKEDLNTDLEDYWASTTRNIFKLPNKFKNTENVIKREYIAFLMGPWLYKYIDKKEYIFNLDMSVSLMGVNKLRGKNLYWPLSQKYESKDYYDFKTYLKMFYKKIDCPDKKGAYLLEDFDNYSKISLFKKDERIYAKRESNDEKYSFERCYKMSEDINSKEILKDGLGISEDDKLYNVLKPKIENFIKDLKNNKQKITSEKAFLELFIRYMDKNFGKPVRYQDIPSGYM
jgi:hypothetical protein